MGKAIRVLAIAGALSAAGVMGASSAAWAQQAPTIVAAPEGGFHVSGGLTVGNRTYTAAELEAMVRAYMANPANLAPDLDMAVRRVVYALALELEG